MKCTDEMAVAAALSALVPGYWQTMSAASRASTIARYRVIVEAALSKAPPPGSDPASPPAPDAPERTPSGNAPTRGGA